MDTAVEKLEAQLKIWSSQIERLAASTHAAAHRRDSTTSCNIGRTESTARNSTVGIRRIQGGRRFDRMRLEAELENAWNDLDSAINGPIP